MCVEATFEKHHQKGKKIILMLSENLRTKK